jgi:hypothetical protein
VVELDGFRQKHSSSGATHEKKVVRPQGHAEFLLEDLPEDSLSRLDAEEIENAADRAARLTRQLLRGQFGLLQSGR